MCWLHRSMHDLYRPTQDFQVDSCTAFLKHVRSVRCVTFTGRHMTNTDRRMTYTGRHMRWIGRLMQRIFPKIHNFFKSFAFHLPLNTHVELAKIYPNVSHTQTYNKIAIELYLYPKVRENINKTRGKEICWV